MGTAGIDIVYNEVEVHIRSTKRRFRAMLELGVFDTCAETMIVRNWGKVVESTAEIFLQSVAQRSEWITLRNLQELSRNRIYLNVNVVARLKADLEDGYIIVAPKRAVRIEGRELIGWWRIDPVDGYTIGLMADGRGAGMTEYVLVTIKAGLTVYCFYEGIIYNIKGLSAANLSEVIWRGTFYGACLLLNFWGWNAYLVGAGHGFSIAIIVAEAIFALIGGAPFI